MDNTIAHTEDAPKLAKTAIENWHLVLALMGIIITGVVGYTTLTNDVGTLKTNITSHEATDALQANAVQALSPQISAMNAKLDIIMKHDGL